MNKKLSLFLVLIILFIFHLYSASSGRLLHSDQALDGSEILHDDPNSSYLRLKLSSSSCDETYGFLPCTTSALGNLFLIGVYGYLMYMAATSLSNGSEILLEILGPGVVGGLFLPILGTLPDAMIVLASGISGSTETAQSQVSVGMGLLAGSTVLCLTLIWGACTIVGKCDLDDHNNAIDSIDTKGFSLNGSGVSTDIWTSYSARIMALSILPFIIVQIPQAFSSSSGKHLAVLIALILSLLLLVSYCIYQILQPWIQNRRLEYARRKRVVLGFIKHLETHAIGMLHADDGNPNEEVMKRLFRRIDLNGDNYLSASELRAFIIGMELREIELDEDDMVEELIKEFDKHDDSQIDENEFILGITRWIKKAKRSQSSSRHFHRKSSREEAKEENSVSKNITEAAIKAGVLLLTGTAIAAIFSDPLVDVVDNFSDATGIPSFFISFVILPLVTSSEAVTGILFAKRKNSKSTSLTFSMIYGSVTMNNVMTLSVFLSLVYFRGLSWEFTSEALIVIVVCAAMGGLASFRTTFPLWTAVMAILLYPLSIVLIYVLEYVIGLS
ncbi:hypothetical protein V2J09_018941 [Rumex salicifolius]